MGTQALCLVFMIRSASGWKLPTRGLTCWLYGVYGASGSSQGKRNFFGFSIKETSSENRQKCCPTMKRSSKPNRASHDIGLYAERDAVALYFQQSSESSSYKAKEFFFKLTVSPVARFIPVLNLVFQSLGSHPANSFEMADLRRGRLIGVEADNSKQNKSSAIFHKPWSDELATDCGFASMPFFYWRKKKQQVQGSTKIKIFVRPSGNLSVFLVRSYFGR